MQTFCPPISNFFFFYNFGIDLDDTREGEVTAESLELIEVQYYMQLVQAVCFIYSYFISMHIAKSVSWGKYFSYGIILFEMIGIPILSMIHLGINYKAFMDETNLLKAWMLVYTMIGVASICYYFLPDIGAKEFVAALNGELKNNLLGIMSVNGLMNKIKTI